MHDFSELTQYNFAQGLPQILTEISVYKPTKHF